MILRAVSASPPFSPLTLFDFTTKCGKIYTFASMHISSPPFPPRIFLRGGGNRGTRREGSKLETRGKCEGLLNDFDGRTIMYHFTDDPIGELRSFTGSGEWIYVVVRGS